MRFADGHCRGPFPGVGNGIRIEQHEAVECDSLDIASDPQLAALVKSALHRLACQSARTGAYSIVRARPGDVSEIPKIELAAARLLFGFAPDSVLSETTSDAVLQEALRQGHLWVALAGNAPVGFAHVEVIDARTAHLAEIDVLPAHGRRGLGTRLVEAVCQWAASAGYDSVTLTTFRDVPWNMPFYERLGFRIVPGGELSAALRAVVEDETRRGLDPSRRVAMQRSRGPTLAVCDEAAPGDRQFVEEQINEFNFACGDRNGDVAARITGTVETQFGMGLAMRKALYEDKERAVSQERSQSFRPATKPLSVFLGLLMLTFGLLKVVNPTIDGWFTVQIQQSHLPHAAIQMGKIGEIMTGLLFLLPRFRAWTEEWEARILLLACSCLLFEMLVATYVHLHPGVPPEVLPLGIKPPVIPLVVLLLDVMLAIPAWKNSRMTHAPGARDVAATSRVRSR